MKNIKRLGMLLLCVVFTVLSFSALGVTVSATGVTDMLANPTAWTPAGVVTGGALFADGSGGAGINAAAYKTILDANAMIDMQIKVEGTSVDHNDWTTVQFKGNKGGTIYWSQTCYYLMLKYNQPISLHKYSGTDSTLATSSSSNIIYNATSNVHELKILYVDEGNAVHIQVWLDTNPTPIIDYKDANLPLVGAGYFNFGARYTKTTVSYLTYSPPPPAVSNMSYSADQLGGGNVTIKGAITNPAANENINVTMADSTSAQVYSQAFRLADVGTQVNSNPVTYDFSIPCQVDPSKTGEWLDISVWFDGIAAPFTYSIYLPSFPYSVLNIYNEYDSGNAIIASYVNVAKNSAYTGGVLVTAVYSIKDDSLIEADITELPDIAEGDALPIQIGPQIELDGTCYVISSVWNNLQDAIPISGVYIQ